MKEGIVNVGRDGMGVGWLGIGLSTLLFIVGDIKSGMFVGEYTTFVGLGVLLRLKLNNGIRGL